MTGSVKPYDDHGVEDQRHGRGSLDGLGKTVGRVFKSQELLAVFKGAFDGPAAGVGGENLPGSPVQFGAVEHLIGTLPLQIAHQDDGQQPVATGFVVQGLDRLDRESGMEPELIEVESNPGLARVLGPLLHGRQSLPFLAGRPSGLGRPGRCRFIERSLGMDVADELDLGREFREDTPPAVGAVTREHDLIVREPLGHQFHEFEGQVRPSAMVRIVLRPTLLPLLLLFLPLGQPLPVAVQPYGDRQGEDFGRRPEWIDDQQAENNPVVSPTDQGLGATG